MIVSRCVSVSRRSSCVWSTLESLEQYSNRSTTLHENLEQLPILITLLRAVLHSPQQPPQVGPGWRTCP